MAPKRSNGEISVNAERAAKELLEEEEKQNAKKKKAAAKKKEKKAKKKKVADPFVPQYMDEAEEAAQAAEAKLAAEVSEAGLLITSFCRDSFASPLFGGPT
jgi:hypothetical protein